MELNDVQGGYVLVYIDIIMYIYIYMSNVYMYMFNVYIM